MKKTLILCGLVLAVAAPPAMAAGLNLNWNDCVTAGLVTNAAFACNVNTGLNTMIGSFVSPAHIDSMCASEYVLTLQSAGPTLSPWWDFTNCRPTSLSRDFSFTAGPFDCVDHWGGNVAISGLSYTPGASGPNRARIDMLAAVGSDFCTGPSQTGIDTGVEYYAFKLTVTRAKTTGTGLCAGCLEPVCVVLNEMKLYSPARGTSDVVLSLTSPDVQNYVTWQGGPSPCLVPVLRRTWGQVKTLYR